MKVVYVQAIQKMDEMVKIPYDFQKSKRNSFTTM